MIRVLAFVLACLVSFSAVAFVPSPSKLGQALGGVVSAKAGSRGFAPTDPRIAATNNAVGTTLGAAAGIAGAAATWAAIGGPLGIAAGLVVGVASLYQLMANGDVSLPAAGGGGGTAIAAGQSVYCNGFNECFSSVEAFAARSVELTNKTASDQWKISLDGCTPSGCYYTCQWCERAFMTPSSTYTSPVSCSAGSYIVKYSSSCSALPASQMAGGALPPEERAKKLNPQVLAELANEAWKKAASTSGYSGLPYDASKPITQADAQAWADANPSYAPTVGDLFELVPLTSAGAAPVSAPNSQTNADGTQNTGVNPNKDAPKIDLGSDPGIGAPVIPEPPTDLFKPIWDALQPWRAWTVPAHAVATCPTWTASPVVAGHTYVINLDSHCEYFDRYAEQIHQICMLLFYIAAVFIILAA